MGVLSASGYLVKSFSELKTLYQNAFKDSFGATIDLSEESPQGVLINKLADLANDCEKSGLDIYNDFNIYTTKGVMLDNIAILKGTQRNDGTKPVLTVELTSSSVPYSIPASTVFNVLNTDLLYWTTTSISVTSTTQEAELIAKVNGTSGITVGDKLQAQTYISALTDIEITAIAEGTDTEDDATLRERLIETDSAVSTGDVNSVYTALYNLDDVQKVSVLENSTDTTDGNGLPPFSINAIVLGDTTQNIVDTIYTKLSAGTPTFGSSSGTYTDIQGYTHTCYFDRPDVKNIWIAASVTAKDGVPVVDGSFNDIIKENCQTYINNLRIGKDVSWTSIYGFFAAPQAFDIVVLQLSKISASSGFAASSVEIDAREYAYMSTTSNIVIEVI